MRIKLPESIDCAGFCRTCGTTHRLSHGSGLAEVRKLYGRLEKKKSIDLSDNGKTVDPLLSTASLFGPQRGKMFGVLECIDGNGQKVWLYGFSGQYNGRWVVPGWAPPLFDLEDFTRLHDPIEREIKELGRQIDCHEAGSSARLELQDRRVQLSRQLMINLHKLYKLTNFRGQTVPLSEAVGTSENLPTGIGDCCAPKLLNQAARRHLIPLSMTEFYFGRTNKSATRYHGCIYAPCADKCRPLLGFLLCGIPPR